MSMKMKRHALVCSENNRGIITAPLLLPRENCNIAKDNARNAGIKITHAPQRRSALRGVVGYLTSGEKHGLLPKTFYLLNPLSITSAPSRLVLIFRDDSPKSKPE